LKDEEIYPIIIDNNDNVLSFPPIINGELTAVDLYTENIFIDVTGTEKMAVRNSLNIIATAFAERGGKIEKVKIVDKKKFVSPNLAPIKGEVDVNYANRMLGIDVESVAIKSLQKMGYDAYKEGNILNVKIPPWRVDILHPVDIVEDIAIGYGYDRFQPALSHEMTFGRGISFKKLHNVFRGLGFNEVVTLSLSNKNDQFKMMNIEDEGKEVVNIENPVSINHTCLRVSLLSSLLQTLSKNKHNELPQAIYEIGDIAYVENNSAKNVVYISGVKISAKTGFTESKSLVEALIKNIGIDVKFIEKKHGAFIEGRCVSLWHDEEIGFYGEMHPLVISNFDLEYPVIAFEINAERLLSLSDK
jgi:phenylalanyl-tRNA synthetase beta chain